MSRKFLHLGLFILASICALGQKGISISGNIIDNKMNPVPSASVYLLNTNVGTFTDKDGKFSIGGITAGNYNMQVSAVGFATISKAVALTGSDDNLTIQLQDAARQLDAVIVSAQKREESVQQIPLSITAISSRQVRDYRLWDIKEITAIVPNLYSADPGDNRNVTSIRGVTSTSYDPAVVTYIDGVNQFGLDTYISQLVDIERIEVLRGPQGTLYGRNAMGGVINIITRQPSNKASGFAELNFGNYGQQRYTAGYRTPVVKDKLFLSIAGMFNKRHGFYTNEFNNSDFDHQSAFTGNYSLKYVANPRLVIAANFKHHNNRNNGSFALAGDKNTAFEKPFILNQNALTKMIDNTMNSSLSVNYVGPSFNFSSQTAYQSNHRYYTNPIDGDFAPIDGITIINNYGREWNKVKVVTQEFKLSSPTGSKSNLNWTAGTYLFFQDNPVKQAIRFGKDAAFVGSPDSFYSVISTNKGKTAGLAFYGQATYSINRQWDIIGGIRFDYEHKKQSVLGEYQKDPNPEPIFQTRPDTSATQSFSAFSPKIGIVYHVSEAHNIYATYSRGYRTGGFTQLSADPSVPPLYSYKPEFSNNVEVGVKNTFLDNRVHLNISAFHVNITNAQVPTLILPDAITITKNAGKLTSNGVELELNSNFFKGFQAAYSVGYVKSTYKTLKLSQNGVETDLEGNRQIFTPEVTSMLAIQYGYDLGTQQNLQLVARGEWIYLGKQYFDLANTIDQGSYNLLNTRIGISAKNIELMFWVRNLGNQKYIAYSYDFGAVHLGNPKTYGITLATRF